MGARKSAWGKVAAKPAPRRVTKKAAPVVDRTKLRTHIALILDRSGSMADVKGAAIEGFNQQARTIRENSREAGQTFVSLTTFAGDVRFDQWNSPAEMLQDLSPFSYHPNGNTAMNDAIGMTINRLLNETDASDPNTSYLVIVVTDGAENASRTFGGPTVAALVTQLQGTGRWTFTVAGANIDLRELSRTLSIPYANTYTFAPTFAGVVAAGMATASGTSGYLRTRGATGQGQSTSFYADSQTTIKTS